MLLEELPAPATVLERNRPALELVRGRGTGGRPADLGLSSRPVERRRDIRARPQLRLPYGEDHHAARSRPSRSGPASAPGRREGGAMQVRRRGSGPRSGLHVPRPPPQRRRTSPRNLVVDVRLYEARSASPDFRVMEKLSFFVDTEGKGVSESQWLATIARQVPEAFLATLAKETLHVEGATARFVLSKRSRSLELSFDLNEFLDRGTFAAKTQTRLARGDETVRAFDAGHRAPARTDLRFRKPRSRALRERVRVALPRFRGFRGPRKTVRSPSAVFFLPRGRGHTPARRGAAERSRSGFARPERASAARKSSRNSPRRRDRARDRSRLRAARPPTPGSCAPRSPR